MSNVEIKKEIKTTSTLVLKVPGGTLQGTVSQSNDSYGFSISLTGLEDKYNQVYINGLSRLDAKDIASMLLAMAKELDPTIGKAAGILHRTT